VSKAKTIPVMRRYVFIECDPGGEV